MGSVRPVAPAGIAERSSEFIGRESIIRQIEGWLEDSEPVFLLTGLPGTGKSQLAFHLAEIYGAQGNPKQSARVLLHAHFCRARDDRTLDPLRFVNDLAQRIAGRFPEWLHALSDDLDQQVRQEVTGIAMVGTAEPGATVAGVRSEIHFGEVSARPAMQRLVVRPLERLYQQNVLPERLLIIVDGLDEALTYPSSDTIVHVLASLAETLPEPVRMVLTTRPDELVLRRLRPHQPHELGTDAADVGAYALGRLACLPEADRKAWARAIVKEGEGNFLYARHVLDDLLAHPDRLAGSPSSAPLPTGLDAYYADYLDRELAHISMAWSDRYRPLLQLLAVARGSGLTWGMLADLSGLLPSQLGDTLSRLRQYLIGPWPEGPLRIYHESLREYLVTGSEHQVYPEEGERALAQYLAAHPQSDYAHAHRAAHAAAAGRLDELLCDADAVLTVEPRSVLAVLDTADTLEGRRAGEAFRIAYPRLGQGISPLHLAALQVGAQQLVRSIAALPDSRCGPWRPSWAWWRRPAPAQTVAALDPAGYSYPPGHPPVAALDTEDGPVAVVATKGRIESWDLERALLLAQAAAPDHVRCIVGCGGEDRPVVAVGDDAGSIALLSVPRLVTLAAVPRLVTHVVQGDAHPDRMTCAVYLPASGLLATGDGIGTISLWTLPDLTKVACRPDAHTLIYSLAAVEVGGEELLVSGGDTVAVAPGYAGNMPSLRVWSIPDLDLRVSELRDNRMTRWLGAIQMGESAFVQVRDTISEVWRLDPGAEAFRFIEKVEERGSAGYLLEITDGEGILAYGHELVPLRAQLTSLSRGRPVDCEPASWSGPILLRGRGKALVSASGKLRLWALRDIMEESAAAQEESLESRQGETFVTKVAAAGGSLCAGTAFGSVHAWTTASTPSHHQHRLDGGEITALAVAAIAGKIYFVAGAWFGGLSLIDCASGENLWTVVPGKRVSAVKIVQLAGRPAALAAVAMSHDLYACRLWELPSGEEMDSFGPPRGLEEMEDWQRLYNGWRLSVDDWRRDKTLNALAAWQTPYGAMAAACCDASPIPIWLLEEQRQVAQLDVDITGARDLDFGHEHLVACSGDRLYIWDASRQWSGITVDAGHPVSSVACGMYTGEPCVASGGYDGSVRMWRFDGSQLGIIDIDEKIMSMTVMHGGRFAIGTQRGLAVIEAS